MMAYQMIMAALVRMMNSDTSVNKSFRGGGLLHVRLLGADPNLAWLSLLAGDRGRGLEVIILGCSNVVVLYVCPVHVGAGQFYSRSRKCGHMTRLCAFHREGPEELNGIPSVSGSRCTTGPSTVHASWQGSACPPHAPDRSARGLRRGEGAESALDSLTVPLRAPSHPKNSGPQIHSMHLCRPAGLPMLLYLRGAHPQISHPICR
jgi:hypothetical protein